MVKRFVAAFPKSKSGVARETGDDLSKRLVIERSWGGPCQSCQPHHGQHSATGGDNVPLVGILNLALHCVVHGAPRGIWWHDAKDANAVRYHRVQPVLAAWGESADPRRS